MTPNYVRSQGISLSPWCDCSSSGNSKPDCERFVELFTNNRCLSEFTHSDVTETPPFQTHARLFGVKLSGRIVKVRRKQENSIHLVPSFVTSKVCVDKNSSPSSLYINKTEEMQRNDFLPSSRRVYEKESLY